MTTTETAARQLDAALAECKRTRIARDRVPYGTDNIARFRKACATYDAAYSRFLEARAIAEAHGVSV